MQSVRTAVVGASGYSGQELLRYLARHPVFRLVLVTSRQNAGQPLSQSVYGLPRELGALTFVDAAPDAVGAYFERLRARPAFVRAAERTESILSPH